MSIKEIAMSHVRTTEIIERMTYENYKEKKKSILQNMSKFTNLPYLCTTKRKKYLQITYDSE